MAKKYIHKSQREFAQRTKAEAKEFQKKVIDDLKHEHEHILEHLQADHEARIAKVQEQHDEQLANIKGNVVEIEQNKGKTPKTLGNGVVVLPGDYYIVDGDVPIGIAAADFAANWAEATKDDL